MAIDVGQGGPPVIHLRELDKKQRRLADVEAFRQRIDEVRDELTAYRVALCEKLEHLRNSLNDDEPQMILTMNTKEAERRMSRRRSGNPISIAISDENGDAEPLAGWITDRSSGGLRIWADDQEPIGSVLTVRPLKAEAWTQVVVRHCRMERTNWVLGCEFVEQPNWNLMRMFG